MQKFGYILSLILLIPTSMHAGTDTVGSDVIYGVKSTGGSTQDWGTIDPTNGTFSSINSYTIHNGT